MHGTSCIYVDHLCDEQHSYNKSAVDKRMEVGAMTTNNTFSETRLTWLANLSSQTRKIQR
ncbi:hypothetical protein E2C01_008132 [Portunus trituberculatus]|uniref:Uncharacterized protein n=1 Tax=Portunus trituberculatus TaxID=210409 RepID=A0A5B7D201_PORTR|nr:hypothetical protein [Portunus trituberculatus]